MAAAVLAAAFAAAPSALAGNAPARDRLDKTAAVENREIHEDAHQQWLDRLRRQRTDRPQPLQLDVPVFTPSPRL